MHKGTEVGLALSVASVLLAGAIVTSSFGTETNRIKTAETVIAQPSGTVSNGVRVVQIKAKKYEFMPAEIVVNQGEKVRFDLTSEDVAHGIVLKEFKVDQRIDPGKPVSVEFTADKAGSYSFHCSVFCGMGHMGMRGKLTVLPATKP